MEQMPVADLEGIIGDSNPLVLAPHADDESLGCGGLLAQCVADGRAPGILVLTDGTGSHPNSRTHPAPILRAVREAEAREAAAILGVAAGRIGFLGLRDTEAPMDGRRVRGRGHRHPRLRRALVDRHAAGPVAA